MSKWRVQDPRHLTIFTFPDRDSAYALATRFAMGLVMARAETRSVKLWEPDGRAFFIVADTANRSGGSTTTTTLQEIGVAYASGEERQEGERLLTHPLALGAIADDPGIGDLPEVAA